MIVAEQKGKEHRKKLLEFEGRGLHKSLFRCPFNRFQENIVASMGILLGKRNNEKSKDSFFHACHFLF